MFDACALLLRMQYIIVTVQLRDTSKDICKKQLSGGAIENNQYKEFSKYAEKYLAMHSFFLVKQHTFEVLINKDSRRQTVLIKGQIFSTGKV